MGTRFELICCFSAKITAKPQFRMSTLARKASMREVAAALPNCMPMISRLDRESAVFHADVGGAPNEI